VNIYSAYKMCGDVKIRLSKGDHPRQKKEFTWTSKQIQLFKETLQIKYFFFLPFEALTKYYNFLLALNLLMQFKWPYAKCESLKTMPHQKN
jgi:hypothetical protein